MKKIIVNSKIISWAIQAHTNTNHLYDGKPYTLHLSMVALNAMKHIKCIPEEFQESVLNACWLHDTIEDCRVSYNDVKKIADEQVANIVYAVTNEKGKNRKERANTKYYEGIRNTPYAIFVKLCDRLANIQYSDQNNSDMFHLYKKEHQDFLAALFPNGSQSDMYQSILKDLSDLIQKNKNVTFV